MTENRTRPLQIQKQSSRPQNVTAQAQLRPPAPAQTQAAQQAGTPPAVHPTLVPELLGISPQMLLDDIISAAADAILQCLQAMEPFMQRWADARAARATAEGRSQLDAEWDGREAVEQGLVAFSTLLESHTDIAFDFLEAWSLRNIFAVSPDLPLVAPHQRGLDLSTPSEDEMLLLTEIEELRRKLENQRRLKRMYTKALRISRLGLTRSSRRLARLSYLSSQPDPTDLSSTPTTAAALNALLTLPSSIQALFDHASSLPHIDGPYSTSMPSSASAAAAAAGGGGAGGAGGAVTAQPSHDPARRLWETSRTGYITWAVNQLLARAREHGPPVTPAVPPAAGSATAATGGGNSGSNGVGRGENKNGNAAALDVLTTQRIGSADAILQLAKSLNTGSSTSFSSETPTSSASALTQNHTLSGSTATVTARSHSRTRTRTPEPIRIPIPIHRDTYDDREREKEGEGNVVNISPSEEDDDDVMDTS